LTFFDGYASNEGIQSLIRCRTKYSLLDHYPIEYLVGDFTAAFDQDISIYHVILQERIVKAFDELNWSEISKIADLLISDSTASASLRAFAVCSKLVALLETCELTDALELFQENQSFMEKQKTSETDWRACEARLLHALGIANRAQNVAASVINQQAGRIAPALRDEAERTALLTAKFPTSVDDLSDLINRWRARFGMSEISCRLDFLEWASRSLRDFHKKKKFTEILQSEISRVINQLTSPPFNLSYERSSGNFSEILWRAKAACDAACGKFLTSIDATEIGNEARFANHSDVPNAAIVRDRTAPCSGPPLMLVALREISKGDEITIHYGHNYWNHPMELFVPVDKKAEKRKTGEAVPPSAWRGCLFFDGVLPHEDDRDVSFMYERIVGDPISDKDYTEILKNRGVHVETCPVRHPCYPGYRLMARKKFDVGERIIIYAGVMRIVSDQIEHLFNNPYTASVGNTIVGNYGFIIQSIKQIPIYHKIQPNLPIFARAQNSQVTGLLGLHHLRAREISVAGIHKIGKLSKAATTTLLQLLADVKTVDNVEEIFYSGLEGKELQEELTELHSCVCTRPIKRKRLN
jgi:hypothetical protein